MRSLLWKISAASVGFTFLMPVAAAYMPFTANVTCNHATGKDRAFCEMRTNNGRPVRRHIREKVKLQVRKHQRLIKDAPTVPPTWNPSSAASSSGY